MFNFYNYAVEMTLLLIPFLKSLQTKLGVKSLSQKCAMPSPKEPTPPTLTNQWNRFRALLIL